MDQNFVHISSAKAYDDILTLESFHDKSKAFPRPLEIHYRKVGVNQAISMIIPIFIHIPIPFPYESTKMLSWNYDLTIHISGNEENLVENEVKTKETKVTNI